MRVLTAGVWLIGIVLVVELGLERGLPHGSLILSKENYLGAARACHEAKSYFHAVEAAASAVDRAKLESLFRSALVALLDCQTLDALRADLLARGVDQRALGALEAEALIASQASLQYLVALPE